MRVRLYEGVDELPELSVDPGEGHVDENSSEFEEAYNAIMTARQYEEARGWIVEGEDEQQNEDAEGASDQD